MMRRIGSRLGMAALTFLVAAGFYLAAPAPRLQASTCGDNDGNTCTVTQECLNILFYKMCTTRYTYYPFKAPLRDVG